MKSFTQVLEQVLNKYSSNGFSVGSVVKFRSGYKNSPAYKDLPTEGKKITDQFQSQWEKHIVRVVNIPSPTGNTRFNRLDSMPADHVQISAELAPGMFCGYAISVPADCLETVDYGVNLPPIPDHLVAKHSSVNKPEPAGKVELKGKEPEMVDTGYTEEKPKKGKKK